MGLVWGHPAWGLGRLFSWIPACHAWVTVPRPLPGLVRLGTPQTELRGAGPGDLTLCLV